MRLTPVTLRAARKVAGCTQRRLGAMIGVSDVYIAMLESGKRRLNDRIERRIREALGLTDEQIAEVERLCRRLMSDKQAI